MTVLDMAAARARRLGPAGEVMPGIRISIDDPRASDVRGLVERHLTFARSYKPPRDVHALDVAGLLDPAVTFFSCRADGKLLAVGALKRLDRLHAELKSMHTAEAARGRGIGRAMVAHLICEACARGYRQVSLKTGSQPAFAPARALYTSAGFTPCGPFGDYRPSSASTFMTLSLDRPDSAA
jgi:putative acetyltransferase